MKIRIEPVVFHTMMGYIKSTPDECSGMAKIQLTNNGYAVTSCHLVKQENGPATTDLDETDLGRLMFETRDVPGMLNCWWHSHAGMSAFWSGTDRSTIEELGKNGFILAIVLNHKGEHRAAFYKKGDSITPDMFLDNLEVEVAFDDVKQKELSDELKKFEVKKTYGSYKYDKTDHLSSLGYDDYDSMYQGSTLLGKKLEDYAPCDSVLMFDADNKEMLLRVAQDYDEVYGVIKGQKASIDDL
jgi:hypothetical protein